MSRIALDHATELHARFFRMPARRSFPRVGTPDMFTKNTQIRRETLHYGAAGI